MLVELDYNNENKLMYFFPLESRFKIVENPIFQDNGERKPTSFRSEVYSNVYILNRYDLPGENKAVERDWYVGPWQNGR